MIKLEHVRNFSIIAHIDHGKTTLSDRMLERTQSVDKRNMQDQLLDSMDLERERGITIKCHPVSMLYPQDGVEYLFNLIDTPGHVDFSYEVSRSLAACEGALLLIDASQGIEAQTVANAHLAIQQNLEVIPVINKVDLPSADAEGIMHQIEEVLTIPADEAILTSAKTGEGIDEVMTAIVERFKSPRWADHPQTRILIFDSKYDAYKGVICYVRIFSGSIRAGEQLQMMNNGGNFQVKEVGRFSPVMIREDSLTPGRVGYIVTSIKDVSEVKIGDTLTHAKEPAEAALPGYKEVTPMVYSGIYPMDTSDYEKLKAGLGRLQLNDSALQYQSESSAALGFGFRCGFLGLLHMEIIQERIRREYQIDILSTYPSVVYHVLTTSQDWIKVDNPVNIPDPSQIEKSLEPTVCATIHIPSGHVGDILNLVTEKRGICDHTETIDESRLMLRCTMPLNEILVDFNDRLKSITKGYGSMDYEVGEYIESHLVKLDILVNGEPVDAFATIVHRSKAESRGRQLCEKLKDILPRQMFKVAIQAAIGSNVIARETLGSYGKDVTAKCYGGDITRKKKLLEKQKKGKSRMKEIGKVSIPQEAFIQILKNG